MVQKSNIFIYALKDPREGVYPYGGIRYIGQTIRGLARLSQHTQPHSIARETNKHKRAWLTQLRQLALSPVIEILEVVTPETIDARERYWIAHAKAEGASLTNVSGGGQDTGCRGYKWDKAACARQSRAQKLRFMNRSELEAHRKRLKEIWARPGYREKINKARQNALTPEVRTRIARSLGGRPVKDQTGRVYPTLATAARELGIRRSGIQAVLRGAYKTTQGFKFTYAD